MNSYTIKIEPSDQNENASISMATLAKRMQDEMLSLVILAAEMQIALGSTLSQANSLSPSVQRNLQAIDRLHQTLDDLQRVVGFLGTLEAQHLPIEPLNNIIKLRHLSHKLFDNVDAPFALTEADSGEISWF